MTTVSAVVLAYKEEPWLRACVEALLASTGADVEVVVVDNGCTDGAVKRVGELGRVRVIEPGRNTGYAGGCNLGARHATGQVVAFINGDALVAPGALAELCAVATRPGVGIATASLRLADQPHLLNSGGNEIHFLGFGWAGHVGQPAHDHAFEHDVTGATGAAFAIRKDLWDSLGGFDDEFVIYHEDADISIRCWQRGLRVVYVPQAVVTHHYEFSRNPQKFYLLERNRLIYLLTCYEARTLTLLSPALVAAELGMVVLAIAQGWGAQKVRGYGWLLRNRRWIMRRRRRIQAQRTRSDGDIAELLAPRLSFLHFPLPAFVRWIDVLLARYWTAVRPRLRTSPSERASAVT